MMLSAFDMLNSKLLNNIFRSPVLNQSPIYVYEDKENNSYVLTVEAIGFSKEDLKDKTLKVEFNRESKVLSVSGKKKIEKIDFDLSVNRRVRVAIPDVDKISVSCENGLLFVKFIKKENIDKDNIVIIEE